MISKVAQFPRKHLGFFLYEPLISALDPVDHISSTNYVLEPKLLPSFEDHLNCTYTVRVSRTWLLDHHRAAITARQFLWGSGIYTDDSDPVAAAIHSGFIKGAWDDGVAADLLEEIIKEQNPTIDVADNVPSSPEIPPTDKDLHITMLVLPRLEKYGSSVRYGQKSRTWPEKEHDAPHDGVSFMVLKCEWGDEGTGKGQPRTGAARRNRIQSAMQGVSRRRGMGLLTATRPSAIAVGV